MLWRSSDTLAYLSVVTIVSAVPPVCVTEASFSRSSKAGGHGHQDRASDHVIGLREDEGRAQIKGEHRQLPNGVGQGSV